VNLLKDRAVNSEFRSVGVAFFCEQVVEQSTWIATILFAYQRNGTRTAGLFVSAMLIVAALIGPFQARLLERHLPFAAAVRQLTAGALILLLASLLIVFRAPEVLIWMGLGLIVCNATTAPASLFGLIPSTARDGESLARQNAQMGWVESAALVLGPFMAAGVLSLVEVRDGVAILTFVGGLLVLVGRLLLRKHQQAERLSVESIDLTTPDVTIDSPQSEFALLRLPALRTLAILTFGAYLTIGSLDVLFVPAAAAAGISESQSGLLAGAYGAGALVSFAVARRIVGRTRLMVPLVVVSIIGSLAIGGLSLTEGRVIAAICLAALAGGCRSVFASLHRVLLQRSSPAGSLLRVSGVFQVLVTLAFAAGVLVPWLAGSTARACIATGLLLPIGLVVSVRGLGRVDNAANVPVTEIALLRRVAILRSLQPASLEALARQSEIRTYCDEPIVEQGDDGIEMFVVVDGTSEVWQVDGGERHLLRTVNRGDVFGEIALMKRQPRTASVIAVGEVRVLTIPGEDFVSLVGLHAGLAHAVDGLMLQRL
jgi:MFS family permease